ncbi:MAG: hypothetical protein L6R41_000607 [Letrouitia leprolyta]|nr:MAG: hypothetical protein L6R41_000607 [Letrouitia leprolyta]
MDVTSSSQSSDDSLSEEEVQLTQRKRLTSTPRTPLSPQDAISGVEESKTQRSSSFVRFENLKVDQKDKEQLPEGKPPRSPGLSPVKNYEDEIAKISPQLQSRLFEKIDSLENQLRNLEFSRQSSSWDKGDESSERTGLSTEIQWMTWQEYLEDASRATNILEVLIEKPHTNSRRKSLVAQPAVDVPQRIATKPPVTQHKNIERIRIRSFHIINALQTITEQTFSSSSRLIIHRPFKVLLFYREQILDYLEELEHDFTENTQCPLGKQCKGYIDFFDENLRSPIIRRPRSSSIRKGSVDEDSRYSMETLAAQTLDTDECRHEVSEELLAQAEAITHLRILANFLKEDMKEVFAKHELLRSSKAKKIAFQDMWHLFMAGDLVVAESQSSERSLELYQVSILPAADFFSSRRPVKEISTRTEGSQHLVESVYKEEAVSAMSVFKVDVFYFDFDGQKFGPVEKRLELVSYEGEKNITDLPIYPLRFHKNADQFVAMMLARGEKFRELAIPNEYPHREYNGLSVGEPQEQIDSQVIIDFALAYRKHPKNAPKFGLRSWIEDDARVVTEACGIPGCTDCFKDRLMFDDHRVDRQRTVEFIRANGALLRTISSNEDLTKNLTQNMMLLLPNRVYGFVLRSRRWHFLNIDDVRLLDRHNDGFENLILPQGVARLVESLVRTHDPQNMPSLAGSEYDDHQVDLVRGKGKGLVVLLHGAPGVGKTSTAECVADYTHRPLFPITCGDIGETSKEVEHNLEQNFSLAHRWGCVLLLDEADVFLQARDRENMRRNSVVSVFLRVLEFYPGILFLTTNKVGHFDEAFKSRIHVSLYYPALDRTSTLKIWKMNLDRLAKSKNKTLEVEGEEIYRYAKRHYRSLHKQGKTTWNGRQIKNAFQTAIALAEFDAANRERDLERTRTPVLRLEHFQIVARASEDFDDYLFRVHGGNEADLAKRYLQRDDDPVSGVGEVRGRGSSAYGGGLGCGLGGSGGMKSVKRQDSSTGSSSESESEERERRRRKKEKKAERKRKEKEKEIKPGRRKSMTQITESEEETSESE